MANELHKLYHLSLAHTSMFFGIKITPLKNLSHSVSLNRTWLLLIIPKSRMYYVPYSTDVYLFGDGEMRRTLRM